MQGQSRDSSQLTVSNGGIVQAGQLNVGVATSDAENSSDRVIVTNADSQLNAEDLTIGSSLSSDYSYKSGDVDFFIRDGGAVTTTQSFSFNGGVGRDGSHISISGSGSNLTVNGTIDEFGNYGKTTFDVVDGASSNINSDLTTGATTDQSADNTFNVSGSSSLLNVSGNLTFSQASGTTILNLSDGGQLQASGDLLLTNSDSGTATINISGSDEIGRIEASRVVFGSGAATLNLNHNSDNYEFSTSLAMADGVDGANANINQQNGRTILTGDNSGYSGQIHVYGGELVINSSLGGNITNNAKLKIGDGATAGSFQGNINISSGSSTVFDRSDESTFAGVISGDGVVDKNGVGTIIFENDQTYTGGTNINEGTLQIGDGANAGSLQGDVNNNSILAFNRSDTVTFSGNTIGRGILRQDNKTGGTLILTGKIDQNAEVEENGILQIGNGGTGGAITGDVALSDNAVLRFNRSNNINYDRVISGDGNVTKDGLGTLVLNGANTYSGQTTIDSGLLLVGGSETNSDARISGDITANTGATLGGFGTIYGDVTMQQGSALSPGASIGTLTVGGLTLSDGSNFIFEANPNGQSDTVIVTSSNGGSGIARISNNAQLTINGLGTGSWNSDTVYTVIKTDNGVEGRFGTVVNNLTFLDYDIFYSATDVTLRFFRNDIDFASIGRTQNQRATGFGVDGLRSNNSIVTALINLSSDEVVNAFDNLSGEIYGSTSTAMLQNSRYMRDAMNRRMLSNSQLPSVEPIWFSSWAHGGRISGDGNALGVDNSGWGIALGLDGKPFDNAFAGVVLGYENNTIKNGGTRNSRSDVDSYHLGTYGATELGGIKLRLGAAYSYLDLTTERHLWMSGLQGKGQSDYEGHQAQLFAEASKDITFNEHAFISPYANIAQVWLNIHDADETGSKADLAINGGTDSVFLTTIGVRSKFDLATRHPLSLYGDVGWVHAYGDTDGQTSNRFASGANRFSVKGVGLGDDVALVGVGIEANVTASSAVTFGYQGQVGSGQSDHSGNLQWKVKF